MSESPRTILDRIGNTSLLALRRIVPANGSRLLLKLESENPTGSIKDRMALAMIEAAEAAGRLAAGGPVVEYTGGSTGVSLAFVCAVKGYPLHVVSSDAFAKEKLDHMKVLGARLQVLTSEGGGMTEKLTRDMVEAARVLAKETGAFWTDQLNNHDQLRAYHGLAEVGPDRWQGRRLRPERGDGGLAAGNRRRPAPPQRSSQDRRGGARRVTGPVGRPEGRPQDRRSRRGLRGPALAE
jgi:cysteine synthase